MAAYVLLLLFFLYGYPAIARELGTYALTFTIAEEDMLAYLESRARQMSTTHLMAQVKHYMKAPPPVIGITRTKVDRTYRVDPSVTLSETIRDGQGNILYPKGTRINPLATHSLSTYLLLIDASDKEQLSWLKAHIQTVKQQKAKEPIVALVKGAPFDTEVAIDFAPVYFDQGGFLCKRLHIQEVPTRVEQEGLQLKVQHLFIPSGEVK